MTRANAKPTKARLPRRLIPPLLFVLPVLAWVLVPGPVLRGFVTGILLGPLLAAGVLYLIVRRLKTGLEERLEPPPLPHGRWDYQMSASSLDGRVVPFIEFSGQVLVLNFWATWCAPCVAEMPSLSRLHEATSDLEVALACVTQEPTDVVRSFLAKHSIEVPVYVLEGDPPPSFGSRAIPATFVLDRSGNIALRHIGAAAWDHESIVNFIRGLAAAPTS